MWKLTQSKENTSFSSSFVLPTSSSNDAFHDCNCGINNLFLLKWFHCLTATRTLKLIAVNSPPRDELTKLKLTKATGLDGLTARLLRDAAPVVAKPITYLVNLTISTGVIPSEWKDSRVTPIFKSGERNDENNYRPISVLSLVSKVLERAVQVQFLAFWLCMTYFLSTNQVFARNTPQKLQ